MSIPKKIHYCWFGGNPLPELAQKCIASWKKYCPDYEIIEWNESNFDINEGDYAREAYEAKKWAFVTDYVRLKVLYDYGGIYMDTDVEVLKPLDPLLEYEAVSGFESDTDIPTGLIASVKNHSMIFELLSEYNSLHFIDSNGEPDLTTNVMRITRTFTKHGFKPNNTMQSINNFTLLPKDYLCPKDWKTGKISITKNTYAIHHFDGSWQTEEQKTINSLRYKYIHFLPKKLAHWLSLMVFFTNKIGFIKMPKAMIEYKINNLKQLKKNEK